MPIVCSCFPYSGGEVLEKIVKVLAGFALLADKHVVFFCAHLTLECVSFYLSGFIQCVCNCMEAFGYFIFMEFLRKLVEI